MNKTPKDYDMRTKDGKRRKAEEDRLRRLSHKGPAKLVKKEQK